MLNKKINTDNDTNRVLFSKKAKLILGALDILAKEKTQIHLYVTKKNVIPYPYYDPRNRDNDIALIRLPKKVKLNHFVNIVKLPNSDFHGSNGTEANITGWRSRRNGYSNTFSQVELTVISNDKCIR